MKWIIANNKPGLVSNQNLYNISHIKIILDPEGKHMVKVNDRNIRNRRPPQWILPSRSEGA